MKHIIFLFSSWFSFILLAAQPMSLDIATNKTITLVFPFSIKHVDAGTKDVLFEQVKEMDNILLVKAGVKDFAETNLSILTSDGCVYSFRVNYSSEPSTWVYHLPEMQSESIATCANSILDNSKTVHGMRSSIQGIEVGVMGIYIKNNIVYYQLKLNNESSIDYDIDFIRLFLKDKKHGKRTATQEIEISPLYVAGNNRQVHANGQNVIVLATGKTTIPRNKSLELEVHEKDGYRYVGINIPGKKLTHARVLPDMH